MMEDKLEHDERIRLECLAQAGMHNRAPNPPADQIITQAKQYEKYVRGQES